MSALFSGLLFSRAISITTFSQLFGEVDPDDDVSPEMEEESEETAAVDASQNGANNGAGEKSEPAKLEASMSRMETTCPFRRRW